ncbi:MAG: hypothetical protein IJU70_10930 [Lentisphaeria bacterium]|nr:hypothetical protein [Lentisphaeria bacterium]
MNRAILIVICDFLVSAMLSMMTGMVPSHTGGTGVGLDENTTQVLLAQLDASKRELERVRRELREAAEKLGSSRYDAQLRDIAQKLAENRLKREQLEEFLKRNVRNTGKLSPETLKKRLDEEKLARYRTEIELKERQEGLRRAREDIREYRTEAGALRKELAQSGKALREMTATFGEAQKKIARAEAEAAAGKRELSASKAELSRRDSDLASVRDALKEMAKRFGQADSEARKLQNTLAFTTGKLSTTERDLAGYRDQLNRLRRDLARISLQRNEAVRNREEMENLVRRTVADLTRARTELEQTKISAERDHKNAIEAKAKLTAAETMLADTRSQLQSNVLDSYSGSAVRLLINIVEERLIMNQRGGGLYYLPLLKFGKRTLVAGYFRTLAGNAEVPMMFKNISELSYRAVRPGADGKAAEVKGPLLSLPSEQRIAALEISLPGVKPLEVITRKQLAKRGIQRLYLFKTRSFGRECAELGGRCSYDLFSRSGNLLIRNAVRGTGSELKAEPGDFVMTGEGKFAGIVVGLHTADIGRKNTAQVYVFEDENAWNAPLRIGFVREPGRGYAEFAEKVRAVDGRITEMNLKAKRGR